MKERRPRQESDIERQRCRKKKAMMNMEGPSDPPLRFTLNTTRTLKEDILFCVDVDAESQVEMKVATSRPLSRLDGVKQAILMFINSKITIDPNHRFAFYALGKSVSWILFYYRSSSPPHYQWSTSQKLFTFDVVYLHDKPAPENCPQRVYEALVDALEHVSEYGAYIFESGQGLPRILFRQVSTLLAHSQQRCLQDDLDIPKSLARKTPAEAMTGTEVVPVCSQ